jgi:competence protein ComEC
VGQKSKLMIFKEKSSEAIGIGLAIAFIADVVLFVWAFWGNNSATLASARLSFLNIGQGDSSLIELPGNVQVLIDGGPDGKKLLENLEQILPPQDRRIDLLIMTHPQLDHFAGFIDVLKKYEVGAFVSSGRKVEIPAYKELVSQLKKRDVPYIQVVEGDAVTIGQTKLRIIGPSPSELVSGELNDTSVVVLLESPEVRALYTGDIGFAVEKRLVEDYNIDVDVLKVGHHGSRLSSGEQFLAEATPELSAIIVGKNTYGHPTASALERLEKYSQKITRSDKDGIIQVIGGANTLQVFNFK